MIMDEELRALADGNRRRILSLVSEKERTAGEIAAHFDISRPAVSQHLKVLLEAGLVEVRSAGTRRHYRLNWHCMEAIRAGLSIFWDERLARLKEAAEEIGRSEGGPKT